MTGERTLETAIRRHVLDVLELHGWNISAAARELGIHRSSLQRMIKKRQLKRAIVVSFP